MSLLWSPSQHSFEVNAKWANLRAIEWIAFPAFVSQPLVPILLLKFRWYEIIIGLILAAFIWNPIKCRFVNIPLASASAIFVKVMKWPLTIGMGVFFLFKGMWLNATISFCWTLIVFGVVPFYASLSKGIGYYELRFMQKMGYEMPNISLG